MKPVYHYLDYRKLIKDLSQQFKRDSDKNFKYADLAIFIGVQPTYLSRVYNGEAHLNSDQLYRLCDFFLLSTEESEFLFLLVEWEKSSYHIRKNKLKKKIDQIKQNQCSTGSFLHAKKIDPQNIEKMSQYFLEPYAPVVHSFFSIERFSKNPNLIANEIGLSPQKLKSVLILLENLNLIVFDQNLERYKMNSDHLHLEKNSSINDGYQKLSRMMSADYSSRLISDEKHQYCVNFGTDPETYKSIYHEFNLFISKVEKLVRTSTPTQIYYLDFQLFPWGKEKGEVFKNSKIKPTKDIK